MAHCHITQGGRDENKSSRRRPKSCTRMSASGCAGPAGEPSRRGVPTLEAVVTETPAHLRKVLRPDIGIAPIDLDASEA